MYADCRTKISRVLNFMDLKFKDEGFEGDVEGISSR